ncbi:MAG: threonylcarbamoyl-AMP synthase [Spirochaetales bacterium]|nr:threonylcarbamoyl-AMP synthase [Spirochaetales bacterium]
MIEYTQAHNPDDRIITRAAHILAEGGIVAYPTDSSWAIGCSSDSSRGLDRLARLREEKRSRFSLICSDIRQMSSYAIMDTPVFRLVKNYTPGPYVFVLDTVHKVEKKIGIRRPEVGMRIPDHVIPLRIVQALGVPIFSITASRDMSDVYDMEDVYAEEMLFDEGWELDIIDGIDLIIDSGETLDRELSTVVRINREGIEIIRQGKGPWEDGES